MPVLRVLSTLAVAAALERLRPAFEATGGFGLDLVLAPTAVLVPRIEAGERADVAILTEAAVGQLSAAGFLNGDSRRTLAVSHVGLAVRAGQPHPAIATEAELKAALLAARSVGLSRTGASGLYFLQLADRLGIGPAMQAKAVTIDAGFTGNLAATGEAEIAIQQVSELKAVPGIEVVGPFPPGLGAETTFTGAVFPATTDAARAASLLAMLAGATAILQDCGLAPV